MRATSREDGFTLPELLISTSIILIALGAGLTTFKNAVSINQSTTQVADSAQNLRGGTNLMVRDLLQAARGIPTGGIPIPSGGTASALNRPSPPGGAVHHFNNTTASTLPAIIAGPGLGPFIDGQQTDIITLLMTDALLGPLSTNTGLAGQATLATDGSSISVGASTAWFAGDPSQGIAAVAPGDLIWIATGLGNTLQTVTRTDATHMYFDANDWFGFNQPNAPQGSVTQIVSNPQTQGTVTRVTMVTYYVDADTTHGSPRLTRVQNAGTPQALAGVVEDLEISYDLVDGVTNPTLVKDLPYTANGVTYSANQIRKVNLHVGVRSDQLAAQQNDYMRNHISTVVSIRSLAFVNRYK